MLDHLHAEDDIEPRRRGDKRLDGGEAIVDRPVHLLRVGTGDPNALVRRVDARHRGAEPRHRFAEQTAAPAAIGHGEPGEGSVAMRHPAEMGGEGVTSEWNGHAAWWEAG